MNTLTETTQLAIAIADKYLKDYYGDPDREFDCSLDHFMTSNLGWTADVRTHKTQRETQLIITFSYIYAKCSLEHFERVDQAGPKGIDVEEILRELDL